MLQLARRTINCALRNSSHSATHRKYIASSMSSNEVQKKFLIDCDPGTDDAHAIMMALARPDVNILGITTVSGNSAVQHATRNVLRLLTVCGHTEIPVFQGSERTLLGCPSPNSGYHGFDGFGDIPDLYPADMSLLQKEHAALALIRIVSENPGEVTLVATAPLTNLALALALDPQFGAKLKDCYIMGGNTEGRGNTAVCGEFNFHTDPEAAYVVLKQLGSSITLLPLELCIQNSYSWDWTTKYMSLPTKKAQFLRDICKATIDFQKHQRKNPAFYMYDQPTMAVAIDSAVAAETQDVYMTVELQGTLARGMAVVDWRGKLQQEANVKLVTKLNPDLHEKMLFKALEDDS